MWTKESWDEQICYNVNQKYLVNAIKECLLKPLQLQYLITHNISIEDILNGRTKDEHFEFVKSCFEDWNKHLGFAYFISLS